MWKTLSVLQELLVGSEASNTAFKRPTGRAKVGNGCCDSQRAVTSFSLGAKEGFLEEGFLISV